MEKCLSINMKGMNYGRNNDTAGDAAPQLYYSHPDIPWQARCRINGAPTLVDQLDRAHTTSRTIYQQWTANINDDNGED